MEKHLVLVGGGHAHMVTLANLHKFIERGHQVSVIGPSPHHYYSGMGPGMLGKTYRPEEIRFATQRAVEKQGGRFILGTVTRVDAAEKTIYLESGQTVAYDVLSFNTGSYVPKVTVTDGGKDIFTVKPIEKLLAAQQRVLELAAQRRIAIGVIGGGPAAVEITGNIWRLTKDHGKYMPGIKIFSGEDLMLRFPEKIRKKARRSLAKRAVEILEGDFVKEIKSGRITLESGQSYDVDLIFLATGVRPSPVFQESGLPAGPDGGLLVNRFLQSIQYPDIFGGGDCIYFQDQPLDKVGVYAVRQNPILYNNLMASLEEKELQPFNPGGDYLLIFNMGDDTGILHKKWLTLGGRPAFIIKDYIDRKFMKKFQSIE
jgi:NADH dehydrogenase FAD-containing subunit